MRKVVVESVACCINSNRVAKYRLTYEVRPLREGLESWFLVSMEEIGTEPSLRPYMI
jgi:hypothetical protein